MSLLHPLPKQRPPTHAIAWAGPVPAGAYLRCRCGVADCRPTTPEVYDAWLDHCLFRGILEATA